MPNINADERMNEIFKKIEEMLNGNDTFYGKPIYFIPAIILEEQGITVQSPEIHKLPEMIRLIAEGIPIGFDLKEGSLYLAIDPITNEPVWASAKNAWQWIVLDNITQNGLAVIARRTSFEGRNKITQQ